MADMLWLKLVTSFLAALQTQFPQPAKDAAPAPAPQAAVIADKDATSRLSADALLTRLEKSDANLTTIQAEMLYDKTMVIAGDQQIRAGKLYFQNSSDAKSGEKHRSFAIHFDTLQLGKRINQKQQQYIFDGEWLIEKLVAEKQIIKRQVVQPGQKFDPLKIGEGPLPIPIGQKKDDINARYDVTLVDAIDGLNDPAQIAFATGSWQLKLIPKEGADRNFKEIRLWYREESDLEGKPLLPRMSRTIGSDDDIALVQLINMKVNKPLPAGVLDAAPPDATWAVDVRPFRQPG